MKPTECTEFSRKNILLDYIISHAINDQRPYLEVSVLGYPVTGLLDTGANRTIVGGSDYNLFLRMVLKLVPEVVNCTVANGESCASIGYIKTPIMLKNKLKWIDLLVVPELSHTLIFGIDF